jgi:hypothetical protein
LRFSIFLQHLRPLSASKLSIKQYYRTLVQKGS